MPLHRFEIQAHTPAETEEIVRSVYVNANLRIAGPAAACRFAVCSVSVGDLAMGSTQAPM
ncbi:MAG: hypothetical protein ICV72_14015, partial [Aldersonia sp.]|nr:hypothetical protein [Aldersonia sp.]